MIVPDARFRPNPNRSISIVGRIDADQVAKHTLSILLMQSESREPITVYIVDSPGGPAQFMESLLRLLKASNQDGEEACQVIYQENAEEAIEEISMSAPRSNRRPPSATNWHHEHTMSPLLSWRERVVSNIPRSRGGYRAPHIAVAVAVFKVWIGVIGAASGIDAIQRHGTASGLERLM